MSVNVFRKEQELYKVSASTGKMQLWFGWTNGAEVSCAYGQLDGKLQTKTYIAEGKNIGRSNETSPEEQAEIELTAMYQAQLDNKHYKISQIEAIEAAEVCRIPRKVTNYKDRYNKMSKTLLSSLKLNGSRACVVDGVLYSKIGRAEEVKVPHLKMAIIKLHEKGLATFDAEVYAHGLSLQRIRSAWLKPEKTVKEVIKVAKDRAKASGKVEDFKLIKTYQQAVEFLGYNPNEDAEKLKFHVFDIPSDNKDPFYLRIESMFDLACSVTEMNLESCIEFIAPETTNSHKERMKRLAEVHQQGYEGFVHYEPEGVYEYGKRSTNTAKSKPRLDAEARVESVTKDKNGEGVLHCTASDEFDNVKFKCKMKVERRDGKRYERDFETMQKLIGKWITFSYEELSEKGTPTKPVGELERLCDEQGRPLE
ncbi:hypothetical protein KUA24_154 [Vibrio phage HNL01]|nr:hypothetical protein KUA24_154 [Vibrio phage HNL01]